jgi:hypothetical protein
LTKTKIRPTLASTWQRRGHFLGEHPPFMLGALPDIKKTRMVFFGYHTKEKKKKKRVGIFLIKMG